MIYPIILHLEDAGYSVEIPDINGGAWTQGDTIAEAIEMAEDLIGAMLVDSNEFPKPTSLNNIKTNEKDIKAIASVDINKYRALNSKSIHKTAYYQRQNYKNSL